MRSLAAGISTWLDGTWRDIRYGARRLRRSPGFTAMAMLTLALGVGANTTLFSLVNALLLQPWRAPDASELVVAYHRAARPSGVDLLGVSAPELEFLRQAASVDVAGTRPISGDLTYGGSTLPVSGRLVSGNYFDVLRAPVIAGRALRDEDNQPGQAAVAVLSHEIWSSLFSSDPAIVGATVRFRDVPIEVIGVTDAGVQESPLAGASQIWMPLWTMPLLFPEESFAREFMSDPTHCCVDLVGRLAPEGSRASAEAELSLLDRRFRSSEDSLGMRVTGTETLYHPEAAGVRPVFALLFAAVSLILLLTCANVANLQLARASARRREITIRLALGATRRAVVRQLLTEGLVLSAVATTLCIFASAVIARAVMLRLDASLARVLDFSIDSRVLSFAAGLAVVTCLFTSLAPALRETRRLVAGGASARRGMWMRSAFLGAQVAMSVVLVTATGLLGRGLAQAASQDVGFRLDELMAMTIEMPEGDSAIQGDIMLAIGNAPVATTAVVPLGDDNIFTEARRAGDPYEADVSVRLHPVSSNYFMVLGIPLRAGRPFRDGASNEVVLNETLARMIWPDGDAVGGHLAGPGGSIGRQVVGVVADAYLDDLGGINPVIFQPVQEPSYLLFHTDAVMPDQASAIIAAATGNRATVVSQPLSENVGASLETASLGARVVGGLSLLALILTAAGTAGVFSYFVTERTREIGIRLALGASRRRIRATLLRGTGRPILVGLLVGLPLAVVTGLVLRGYLYGLSPSDPLTYGLAVLVVILTAWTSTVVPMRRALGVDPAVTLRCE